MLEGLRSEVKPGWESMLIPWSDYRGPSLDRVREKCVAAAASVDETLRFLELFSFTVEGRNVLEIGCHDGARCHALAARSAGEVVGSDILDGYILQRPGGEISDGSLEEQRRRLSRLREMTSSAFPDPAGGRGDVGFVEDDICSSSLPDSRFDLVCSWDLLEHAREPERLFANVYRLLKPGGLAFHDYNPFFSLGGGHSLCTLDFPWGHARLDAGDFHRYLEEVRPREAVVAGGYYDFNLNRMTIADCERHGRAAGLETVALILWPDRGHLGMVSGEILCQARALFPTLSITDLITPVLWLLQRKPRVN